MIRPFARKHPRTIAVSLFVTLTLVLAVPYAIWGVVDLTEGSGVMSFDGLTAGLIWPVFLSVVLLGIVWALDWFDITGLRGKRDKMGTRSVLWIGALPTLGAVGFIVALLISQDVTGPVAIIVIVLVLNFFVGLSEEVMFRGIVFGALRQKHQLFTAVCLSSLAFGMLHLVNLGLGQAMSLTLFQVINATALGALFCAVRLQTNSIWPPVFLHMIWNGYVMLGQALSEAQPDPFSAAQSTELDAASFLLPTILIVIAYWVFRSYTRRTGQSLFQHAPTSAMMPPISA